MFDFSSLMSMFGGGSDIPKYFRDAYPATALNNSMMPNFGYGATPGSPMTNPLPSTATAASAANPAQVGSPANPASPQNLRQMMIMQALMGGDKQQQQPQMSPPNMAPPMPQMPNMQNRFAQSAAPNQMGMPMMQPRRFLGQG